MSPLPDVYPGKVVSIDEAQEALRLLASCVSEPEERGKALAFLAVFLDQLEAGVRA